MPIVDAGLIRLRQYLQVVLANLDGPDVGGVGGGGGGVDEPPD